MRKALAAAAAILPVLGMVSSGCARYSSKTTELYSLPEGCMLEISTFNGSITVEWYDGQEMSLEVTRTSGRSMEELEKAEVIVDSGPLSSVEARKLVTDADVGVSFAVMLPIGVEISELETSNGRIFVSGGSGSARARSSNGSITFEDFSGAVTAETSNGSITVTESDLVYASSSNGSITGRIGSIPPEGITLRTSNGSITVEIGSDLNADLEMDTSNGSISLTGDCFSDIWIDDSEGRAVLGTGGETVILDASNGSIRVTEAL